MTYLEPSISCWSAFCETICDNENEVTVLKTANLCSLIKVSDSQFLRRLRFQKCVCVQSDPYLIFFTQPSQYTFTRLFQIVVLSTFA